MKLITPIVLLLSLLTLNLFPIDAGAMMPSPTAVLAGRTIEQYSADVQKKLPDLHKSLAVSIAEKNAQLKKLAELKAEISQKFPTFESRRADLVKLVAEMKKNDRDASMAKFRQTQNRSGGDDVRIDTKKNAQIDAAVNVIEAARLKRANELQHKLDADPELSLFHKIQYEMPEAIKTLDENIGRLAAQIAHIEFVKENNRLPGPQDREELKKLTDAVVEKASNDEATR